MTAAPGAEEREVLPRWRSISRTTAQGELDTLSGAVPLSGVEIAELEEKQAEWLANRSVSFAAEFVSAALVLRCPELAIEAADFILSGEARASSAERSLANRVTQGSRTSRRSDRKPTDFERADPETAQRRLSQPRVRALRARLRRDPRNAIAWVDLAHEYTILGQRDKAERAIQAGISLGSENRFILRSAARFFVHQGNPGRGHDILLGANSTRRDPWLLAAELAVAAAANRTSRFARLARSLIASESFAPHHLTELASALGTLELREGNHKRARRLFRMSLDDPTENSLAQAEWASTQIVGLTVEPHDLGKPRAYEARARSDFEKGAWTEAVEEAWQWHTDQPFDADATAIGSYVAAVGLEDYEECTHLAQAGLLVNPDDPILRNNYAFGLLKLGLIDAAGRVLAQISVDELDQERRPAHLATLGLYAYRMGHAEKGRALYSQAIETARSRPNLQAMAALMMALEEMRMGTEEIRRSVESAFNLSKGSTDVGVRLWRDRLTRLVREHGDRFVK